MSISIVYRFALLAAVATMLTGCILGGGNVIPAMKQLPAEAQVLLAKKGLRASSPIFVRIFKEESQLEIWKKKDDGRYYHFKTYPLCAWSGSLGPKVKAGDKQAPEGFYTVTPGQMNPNSQFHLAFNLGYPNAYDRANGRTGSSLMVHGDCRSAGCFAMTDALIEEIYILAREAFQGGQRNFQVHAFPFRMTLANMKRHKKSKWYGFWKTMKEGYDAFELSRVPPKVAVCSRHYLVNANFFGQVARPDPTKRCPSYQKVPAQTITPFKGPIHANTNGAPNQNANFTSQGAAPSPAAAAQMRNSGGYPQYTGGNTASTSQSYAKQPAGGASQLAATNRATRTAGQQQPVAKGQGQKNKQV
ncbi:MAG: murein L,D-transpeptidase, partial [Alphaproteobacteria bacterium]